MENSFSDLNTSMLELPKTTRSIIIDIGPNRTPIIPSATDTTMFVLAFEPLLDAVANIYLKYDRVLVVPCAVASIAGIRTLRRYNQDGLSSSLSRATLTDLPFQHPDGCGQTSIVPVITLKMILQAIPNHIHIFLKTDAQGFDFDVIQSAGDEIKRVLYMRNEVYTEGYTSYENVNNDLEKQ